MNIKKRKKEWLRTRFARKNTGIYHKPHVDHELMLFYYINISIK